MGSHTYKIIYNNDQSTPLGKLNHGCYLWYGSDFRDVPLRLMGCYAITLLIEGNGIYRNAQGLRYAISAGDMILSFPDVGVRFAPPKGSTWHEIFIKFQGPIFDFLRRQGLLDEARPVVKLGSPEPWVRKIEAVLGAPRRTEGELTAQVGAFASLLVEMLSIRQSKDISAEPADWLSYACDRLRRDIGETNDVKLLARECGMSYESFRKRFRDQIGKSPAQYRAHYRLEAAKALLGNSQIDCKEIAVTVGYASPYHFSRKFKAMTGVSPRQFRRARKD